MTEVKNGDKVKVYYTGKLDDGTVFDSTKKGEPMMFTLGQSQVIQGFEKAVIGMKVGESKTVKIKPDKAYGPYLDNLILKIDRKKFPPYIKPEPGQHLNIPHPEYKNQKLLVTITYGSSSTVTVDCNHPLAGKELTFEIELAEIL